MTKTRVLILAVIVIELVALALALSNVIAGSIAEFREAWAVLIYALQLGLAVIVPLEFLLFARRHKLPALLGTAAACMAIGAFVTIPMFLFSLFSLARWFAPGLS